MSPVYGGQPNGPIDERHTIRTTRTCKSLQFAFSLSEEKSLSSVDMPFLAPFRLQVPAPPDWLPLLVLATLCTVVAHTWNIHLLGRLRAYTANLTMNFEPVWGILLGAALFHEHTLLHPAFYVGAALIILANFLDPILQRRFR